jgi:hypothetical protein
MDSLREVARMERDLNKLSEEHKKRLKFDIKERIFNLKKAIFRNYFFLIKLVEPYKHMFKWMKTVKIKYI